MSLLPNKPTLLIIIHHLSSQYRIHRPLRQRLRSYQPTSPKSLQDKPYLPLIRRIITIVMQHLMPELKRLSFLWVSPNHDICVTSNRNGAFRGIETVEFRGVCTGYFDEFVRRQSAGT